MSGRHVPSMFNVWTQYGEPMLLLEKQPNTDELWGKKLKKLLLYKLMCRCWRQNECKQIWVTHESSQWQKTYKFIIKRCTSMSNFLIECSFTLISLCVNFTIIKGKMTKTVLNTTLCDKVCL